MYFWPNIVTIFAGSFLAKQKITNYPQIVSKFDLMTLEKKFVEMVLLGELFCTVCTEK